MYIYKGKKRKTLKEKTSLSQKAAITERDKKELLSCFSCSLNRWKKKKKRSKEHTPYRAWSKEDIDV
jgi:hypothetical protein